MAEPSILSKTFDPDSTATKNYISAINTTWKNRLFLLKNLPSVIWWGIKIKSCSPYRTEIEIPFNWRTQNPFRSIYFAALAGAAELSTGLMANIAMQGRGKISMLVTNIEMEFVKKANAKVTFTCDEGIKHIEAIQKTIDTGEGVEVTLNSIGRLPNGDVVSRLKITWSFKQKTR